MPQWKISRKSFVLPRSGGWNNISGTKNLSFVTVNSWKTKNFTTPLFKKEPSKIMAIQPQDCGHSTLRPRILQTQRTVYRFLRHKLAKSSGKTSFPNQKDRGRINQVLHLASALRMLLCKFPLLFDLALPLHCFLLNVCMLLGQHQGPLPHLSYDESHLEAHNHNEYNSPSQVSWTKQSQLDTFLFL